MKSLKPNYRILDKVNLRKVPQVNHWENWLIFRYNNKIAEIHDLLSKLPCMHSNR